MKKVLVKMLAVTVALMIFSSMLAGCGGSGGTARNSGSQTSSVTGSDAGGSSAETLEPVNLRFYFPGDKKSAADEVWNALAEKFKDKLNCTYEVNWIAFGDYKDKLMVMAASGDDWDMNYDGPWQAYTQMQNKGAYMDISQLLPKYAPDLYKKYQETGTLRPATVGDKVVALPWTLSGSLRPWFDWRSDAAEKAGIKIEQNSVKTIEDIDTVVHEFKKAYPDQTILALGQNNLNQVFQVTLLRDGLMDAEFHNFYYDVNGDVSKLIPIEQTETFRDTVKIIRKWVEDGIISKDEMTDKMYEQDKWDNGKTLCRVITHEWSLATEPFKDPAFTKDYSELYPENKFFNRTPLGNTMCVNRNAKNPERALMWMNMMETNQEFYDMVFYGIEGKTYVLDGKTAKYPNGMTSANSNYMDWPGQWTLWKPQFMRPDATYGEGFWQREADYAKNPVNIDNPVDGIFYNTDSIKNEISRRDQIFQEFGRPLIYGLVKAENIDRAVDEYIQKQKDAGLDKILAECHKQLDSFKASRK